jgi:ribosomal protein S8E
MKLSKIMMFTLALLIGMSASVQAKIVSSASVMQSQQLVYNKQQIITLVNSQDIQQQLSNLGVSNKDALARIDAMTASELASFNEHLNDAEAGGILGVIVTVLVVVLVTDLLGITDAYPFIRPIGG